MSLLGRASRRYLGQHRAQLVLSVVGVALGVAVVLAVDLAIESSRAAFRISVETVSGRATHQVVAGVAPIEEGLMARLRTEGGAAASAPVVEGYGASPAIPGRALRILGVDPFSEGPFRPYVAGGGSGLDVSAFVTTARAVVLSAPTARAAELGVGDTLLVVVEGQTWRLPVVGLLEPSDRLARVGLGDVLLMDIAGAQDVLRLHGGLSRIDLRLPAGDGGAVERVRTLLPAGITLERAGARADTMAGMIAAFDLNLTALSLLALIFGMFLIYNAVTFSVVQRRPILARLRAVGVTRGEILRLVLGEAAWVGAAGALLGVGGGILLSRGLVRLVTRTINDLYFSVSVGSVAVEPLLVVQALALGVAATLLAALPPALEASGARPRLAGLRSVSEARVRRAVPRIAAAGAAASLAGAGLILVSGRSVGLSFAALFLVITGLAAATPAATVWIVSLVRPVLARLAGVVGVIASRGVVVALSRTAPAVAALTVAVSVTVGLGVMIQSFRGTLVRWLDGTLVADVYVSLPGPRASSASGTLWPELIEDFVAHPDVVGHSTYRGSEGVDERGAYRLVALDLDRRGTSAFDFRSGDRERIMAGFRGGEGVIVSEPFAYRREVGVGDSVPLGAAPTGLPILGVFRDYGSDRGTVMVARSVYDRLFDDSGVTSLGLFLAEGADPEAVSRELLSGLPEGRAAIVRSNQALRSASLEVFDRTFEVTAVLRLLALLVAFVGVLSALMAMELERARELGVLRATGMTPGQVGSLVVTQTGLLGLVAGVLAVPLGIVLSVVMIFVVNKRSFGWTLEMQVGPDVIAQAIGLAVVGALVAGVYPAWRMARTSPAVALRGE